MLRFDGLIKYHAVTGDNRIGYWFEDIYYDHERSYIVATDGVALIASPVEPKDTDCECSGYIPVDVVKKATEKKPMLIAVKKETIEVEEGWNGRKYIVQRADSNRRFPDWIKFVPDVDRYIDFIMPVDTLKRIATAFGGDRVCVRIPAARIGNEIVSGMDKVKLWRVEVMGGVFQGKTDIATMGAIQQAPGKRYAVRDIEQESGNGTEEKKKAVEAGGKIDGADPVQGTPRNEDGVVSEGVD